MEHPAALALQALYDRFIVEGKVTKNTPDSAVLIRAINSIEQNADDLKIAREALEFYANPDSYAPVPEPTFVSEDAGQKARWALVRIDNV